MRYTPGPWFYNYESGDIFEVRDSEDNPAEEIANHVDVENGPLIAAAPELLEALKNIIVDDEMRDGDLPQELVNMAKAVILKAEGRS